MKNILFLIIVFYGTTVASQSPECPYFHKYIQQGDAEMKKDSIVNFEAAINAYSIAMLHCPDKAETARQKIIEVFKAIEKLRTAAEQAGKRMADALQQVETEKRNALVE